MNKKIDQTPLIIFSVQKIFSTLNSLDYVTSKFVKLHEPI